MRPSRCTAQGVLARTLFPRVTALEDSSYVTRSICHTARQSEDPNSLRGQDMLRTPDVSIATLRILGVLRLRAHHFRKAPTRSGASLRMTEGGVMEEPHASKKSILTRTRWNSTS